jgi:hypothetical protein
LNGTKNDEAAIVRQVSLRQRSARLSFLPGRRQQHQHQHQQQQQQQQGSDGALAETVNGNASPESKTSHSRSRSSSKGGRRQSIFRSQPMDEALKEKTVELTRRGSSASKGSLDRKSSIDEHVTEAELPIVKRTGSVRKRLSRFKIGIKSNKSGGVMGSVDEE